MEVSFEKLTIEQALSIFTKLTASIRAEPTQRAKIRERVNPHTMTLLTALNEFIADARQHLPDGKTKLAMIVDNLDRIPIDFRDNGRSNHEEIFLDRLRRKQGFGLFFVQCTPDQGEKVVAELRRDLSQQKIEELHLQGEVVTLHDQIAEIWNEQRFDVLVIDGLEASLYAYEDTKRFSGWSSEDIYNYRWKGVPQILNHLNQQREQLRNDFPVRLVFLVPSFVVDYFIQRAADFLDWRSGLFRFPADPKEVVQDAERFVVNGNFTAYKTLTSQERIEKNLASQDGFAGDSRIPSSQDARTI